MQVLVFQFRLLTVEYFMDTCTEWEINDLIDNIPYLDRNLWESQRLGAYITAQVNSSKKFKQTDICKFKWEESGNEPEEHITEISDQDIERLRKRASVISESEIKTDVI